MTIRKILLLTAIAMGFLAHGAVSNAQEFDGSKFRGFLGSGEFAPAQRMIRSAPEGQRDGLLAEMAASQRAAGAFQQAGRTVGGIRSDNEYASASRQGRDALGQYSGPMPGRGGGIQADFDPLMELIQRTVEPESWEDLGGTGRMSPFEAGVHVDPQGVLRQIKSIGKSSVLDRMRGRADAIESGAFGVSESGLRLISLPRLERAVQQRISEGLEPTDAMKYLGGLRRIDYVIAYPETGDLVIAGPAEPWRLDSAGRPVGIESGQPLLWLDDFVACWRAVKQGDGIFGCSIDPRAENLEAAQKFMATSKTTGKRWREGLQSALGRQDITVHGIDPTSHAAHVLIKADYHMKLVGMGIEPGVLGVTDVLSLMAENKDEAKDSSLIRWWFTLDYESIRASEDRLAFQLEGPAVKVLSENEWLDAMGRRHATGTSDQPTREFASAFSRNYEALSEKYPVYSDLRNVFDLAMIAGVIHEQGLDKAVDWQANFFGDATSPNENFKTEVWPTPREVDTVMNYKEMVRRKGNSKIKDIFIGVSGGVRADVGQELSSAEVKVDDYQEISAQATGGKPASWQSNEWWWDR